MPRYTLTEYADASKETRQVYDDYLHTTGSTAVPVWLKSMGHSHKLARSYWEKAKGTLFGGILPLPLKEMIVFVVSARNGSRYCSACHADCILNLDKTLRMEDLEAFLTSHDDFSFPPYYKPVVDFAIRVQSDPNNLDDSDFNMLKSHGFEREEIHEIISVIDMTMMFNTYTGALRLELDPEYRAVL